MNDVNREVAEKVIGKDWMKKHWHSPFEWFDPMNRIEHSMLALDTFSEWDIRKRYINGKPQYGCIVYGKLGREFHGQADTKEEAICRAALAAKEDQ